MNYVYLNNWSLQSNIHLLGGPYRGCAPYTGHFFSSDSLAESVILEKIPKPNVYVFISP